MANLIITEKRPPLKALLYEIKGLINRAEFLMEQTQFTQKDKLILRFNRLLTDSNSHYFGPEAKLFISSQYMTIASVIDIMEERGEKISRSGCENRMLNSAQKFANDFGLDCVKILLSDIVSPQITLRLDEIELKLLSLEQGLDYTANALDELLKEHNLDVIKAYGFNNTSNITQEELDEFLALIEPYTKQGLEKRRQEMAKFANILWRFRKATVDGIDDSTVSYILRKII